MRTDNQKLYAIMDKKMKKLIVKDFFPVNEISEESVIEKNGRPSIFEMHYWWTRKPLITARSSILLSSVTKDLSFKQIREILGIEEILKLRKKRSYNKDPSRFLNSLKEEYKKSFGTETPTLLDPFAGGGSIPFEALRLGFNVIASDYNPVSYILLKATLEYPKKHSNKLINIIRDVYEEMSTILRNELEGFYPKNNESIPSAYISAWEVKCPHCNFANPLVNNWVLSKKKIKGETKLYKWIYLNPVIIDNQINLEIIKENAMKPSKLQDGNCVRGKGICLKCKNVIENSSVLKDILNNSEEFPLATIYVKEKQHGKLFEVYDNESKRMLKEAKNRLKDIDYSSIPNFKMKSGVIISARYLESWDRLFNPRQLLFFSQFIVNSRKLCEKYKLKYGEIWGEIVSVYLSLLLAKLINRNCRISGWDSTTEKLYHALAFRGMSIVWDHAEVNPFAPKGSGTLRISINNILTGLIEAVKCLSHQKNDIHIELTSALDLRTNPVDLIVTDPPYGDDVPYSELSDFFYSWQQLILKEYFPHLPSGSVPSSEDLSDNRVDRRMDFVQLGLQSSFKNLHSLLNDSGYLTLFFAHSSLDTWSFVVNALSKAGFQIFATYPIHTENPNNIITRGKASFFTSILMFSSKRKGEKSAYLEDLELELIKTVRSRVRSFLDSGLRGADLSMAALGPALEILTSYSDLKTISGSLDVADVLALTNKPVIEETLGQFMENVGSLDSFTQLYLFARVNGMTQIPFDTLQILSKSLNIDLSLSSDLLLEKQSGKHKLFSFNSYDSRDIKLSQFSPLIDYLHFAFQQFESKGESAFWSVFTETGITRHTIIDILSLVASGLIFSDNRVSGGQDLDTKIASQLLSLSPDYKPLRRMGEKQRVTTLDEFTRKDETKNE